MTFPRPADFLAPEGPFEAAARASDAVAARWQALLTEDDRARLIEGFHLAETLAGHAIVQARGQVPAEYHAGLDAQAADEDRHIAVFAGWMPTAAVVTPPQVKSRQTVQWMALLLVNELAGFCQFRMLARLLEAPEARAAIDEIARDERVHVTRLLNWIFPLWETRSARPVEQFIQRFRRDLPGRMCQFFPRAGLRPLREEMVAVIDRLLSQLPSGPEPASRP